MLEFSEDIDVVEHAIDVEKEQPQTVAQALIQLSSKVKFSRLSESTQSTLSDLLEQDQPDVAAMPSDEMAVDAPQAAAYESHSEGTIEVLEKVDHDFIDKKAELEKDEMKADFAFQSIMQQLNDD